MSSNTRMQLTIGQRRLAERESLHNLDVLAYLGDRAEDLAAVTIVASDVHDVRARAEYVVRAGREHDRAYLRILLPFEGSAD